MQRKHGAGDAGVSPHKGAMFESWFERGGRPAAVADHRDGEALASGRTIRKRGRVIGSQASLVRRRQFANKSCQAEEEQVRPRRLIIISEMIKQ